MSDAVISGTKDAPISKSCMVDGDPNAPILLVGMAPGREELVLDRPFVGGSGSLLWAIAKSHGIFRPDCYIVNIIGEFPEKKNGSPSARQLSKFRPAFEEFIQRSRARIVVPLGGDALESLTGLKGIENWRGYLVKPSECSPVIVPILKEVEYKTSLKCKACKGSGCDKCNGSGWAHRKGDPRLARERSIRPVLIPETAEWIMPCLHPAGVLRSGRKTLPAFNADLGRIKRALDGKLRKPMTFEPEIKEGCFGFDDGPVLVDVETRPYLRVGMAGTVGGNPACWTAPLDDKIRETVRRTFSSPSATFVAHNAQFDLAELARHNMAFPLEKPIFDTMMAAQHLQPDLYKGLNEVASLYFDIPRWKHKAEEDPIEYNLTDVKREYELYTITKELIEDEGMGPLFYNATMPGLKVLTRMTARGINLHDERRIKWLADLTQRDLELRDQWSFVVGDVNPRSPDGVKNVLYKKYRLPLKYNKTGGETAERAALYELLWELEDQESEPAKVIKLLLEFRVNNKLLTSYAKKGPHDDGCVHPYYLPVTKDSDTDDGGKGMAGTGRIQARDPNIQQLPPDARAIVIPHSDSLVLVSFDFKQLELRIAAALSHDEALQSVLANEDPFEALTRQLGCDRTRAKNVAYGTVYGGGPKALVKALRTRGVKLNFKEAKELQHEFAKAYPKLWAWRQHVMDSVAAQYYLTTPYGRRRYFYNGRGDGPAAVDFKCQGTAADISWYSLDPLDEAITDAGGSLLAQIHDEFLAELPKDAEVLKTGIRWGKDVLERVWPEIAPGFFVPVGVKVGADWKNMEKVNV